jgi:hypothetical protein
MLDVLTACRAPEGGKSICGVFVPAHAIPELPGVFLTDVLDPLDAYEEKNGVIITHGATGMRLARVENVRIAARTVRRLAAVSFAFEIDWTKKTPVLKKDRRRMAAVRWALDACAAMFNAPCPDAIPTCMGRPNRVPDHILTVLLG